VTNRATNILLGARDQTLLRLLDYSPLTTGLILKASQTFVDGPFRDERRARERMQALSQAGLVRSWPLALPGGGVSNYYKLTPEGYRVVHGEVAPLPHGRYFAAIPLARLEHTQTLAEVIVHTHVACHHQRVAVTRFCRENSLTLKTGIHEQQPDCMFQLCSAGKRFNVLFEIDNSTEPLDALSHHSVRHKILGYEAYQDHVWQLWKNQGAKGPRPSFRVAFLTRTIERAHHLLVLAGQLARNPERRLCYTATQDEYLACREAVREPLFLDHEGHWHALVNIHPSVAFPKPPVRLRPLVTATLPM
jgi:hypothetical protein